MSEVTGHVEGAPSTLIAQELGSRVRDMLQGWDVSVQAARHPLKRVIHRFIATYLKRQANFNWGVASSLSLIEGALGRLEVGKASVGDCEQMMRRLLALEDENRSLRGHIDELKAHVDAFKARSDVSLFEHRLTRLERSQDLQVSVRSSGPEDAPQSPLPEAYTDTIDYFLFEARFRGPREDIRELHKMYLPYVERQAPVLDIGCGRGEFLELLRDAGVRAMGVDLEASMVSYCQSIGLDVQHGDAFAYLRALEDGSLGAIFLGQVVEHMPPGAVALLFGLAFEKLRPGGVLIAETVNPICPTALANFFLDPTHDRPVHPELLMFLAESKGFESVEYLFSSPLGGSGALRAQHGQPEGGNAYMDYAVIVRRPGNLE